MIPMDFRLGNQPVGNQRQRTEDDVRASILSLNNKGMGTGAGGMMHVTKWRRHFNFAECWVSAANTEPSRLRHLLGS